MRYIIENEEVLVELESFGAEIKSLVDKQTNQEYMWSGDPKYWGKTAPFLFPFIGKLKNEQFKYEGQAFTIDKHGFGQRMEYEVVEKTDTSILFQVFDTEETYLKYPFHFKLQIQYEIVNKSVKESWFVTNLGEREMFFSIGGHAAFACPLFGEGKRTGNFIKLHGITDQGELESLCIDENGLITENTVAVPLEYGNVRITEHLFDQDALVFAQKGIVAAGLCNEKGEEYIRVECNAPVWGIWTMPNQEASYVCLEPWYGICDEKTFDGEISERPFTNKLAPNSTWTGQNIIKFGFSIDK